MVRRAAVVPLLVVQLAVVPMHDAAAKSGLTTYGDMAQYAIPGAAAALSGAKDHPMLCDVTLGPSIQYLKFFSFAAGRSARALEWRNRCPSARARP